jgi:hypothetical protein
MGKKTGTLTLSGSSVGIFTNKDKINIVAFERNAAPLIDAAQPGRKKAAMRNLCQEPLLLQQIQYIE